MLKRTFFVLVIATLLLSACKSARSLQPPAAGPVTITWAFWGTPQQIETHRHAGEVFMAGHPHIKIEYLHRPPSDYFTTVQTPWASGTATVAPDVLLLEPVAGYAVEGLLEELDPWLEQSGVDLTDYWPATLEPVTANGHIYGLPANSQAEVLYYNQDLFDEAALEYPTERWTWDQLQAAVDALTELEVSGRVARYGLAAAGERYSLWIEQNNGRVLDDMHNPSRCTLTEPAAASAVNFFAQMMNSQQAIPAATLSQTGGEVAAFQNGQAAMIVQDFSPVPVFNRAGLNYDVVAVPVPAGGRRAAGAGGPAWAISARSQHKAAAWEFLSWLQSAAGGQSVYAESGQFFPALQSVARSAAFLQASQPPANRQVFLTEAENAGGDRVGVFPEWTELEGSVIEPGLQPVWAGQATIEETLPRICAQVDGFLAQRGYPRP